MLSLRMTILSLFLAIMVGLTAVLIAYNFTKNREAALLTAEQSMEDISSKILERTKLVFDPAFQVADAYSALPNIGDAPNFANHPVTLVFLRTLLDNKNLSGMYTGYDDGRFFFIMRVDNQTAEAKKTMGAPDSAAFMIQFTSKNDKGRAFTIRRFIDENFHIMGSNLALDTEYDPRKRPWYKLAADKEESVLSNLYMYSFSHQPGLTISRRFNGQSSGVMGVDIALARISSFLKEQLVGKNSNMFIFRADGQIVAYPDIKKSSRIVWLRGGEKIIPATLFDLKDPVLEKFYSIFNKHNAKSFKREVFKIDGVEYISSVTALPEKYGRNYFLASVIPLSQFTAPIMEIGQESIMVSFLIMLLAIPIVVFAARKISHPLRVLADEARAITSFKLDNPLNLESSIIKEVRNLNSAMESMKSSLSVFGKFVPRALVEKIVRMNIVPELGGERRELTILFSDIADFTTTTENTPPEELAIRISEYFDEVAKVIIENGGTIDKYIGDAVMAFWNAPSSDEDHVVHACHAALQFQTACLAMNRKAEEAGINPFYTRIGLHCGDTLVGYIGSADRMDYTAMGSVVNLASRIEGLNKYFGTSIMVSDCVVDAAEGKFVFRTVGKVLAKGTTKPTTIFELVGENLETCTFDDHEFHSGVGCASLADWEKAYALYLDRDWDNAEALLRKLIEGHPEDVISQYYLDRIVEHRETPPSDDWVGVITFSTK